MTISETLSAMSLVVSVGALLYTARSVNASRRAIQLQIFDSLFREIKRLDQEYIAEFQSKSLKPHSRWCTEFFNTLEYMAFLLNHKMILREEMHDFYKDAVIYWYRTFAANSSKKDLDNPDFFPEFKKLHRILKNDG